MKHSGFTNPSWLESSQRNGNMPESLKILICEHNHKSRFSSQEGLALFLLVQVQFCSVRSKAKRWVWDRSKRRGCCSPWTQYQGCSSKGQHPPSANSTQGQLSDVKTCPVWFYQFQAVFWGLGVYRPEPILAQHLWLLPLEICHV